MEETKKEDDKNAEVKVGIPENEWSMLLHFIFTWTLIILATDRRWQTKVGARMVGKEWEKEFRPPKNCCEYWI